MGIKITLDANDIRQARNRMQEVSRRTSMRPVFVKIAAFLRYETQRNFDTGGRHAGNPWAPNELNYKRWKYRNAKDARVLHRYLKLRRALATKYGADHVEKASASGLSFGINPSSEQSRIAGAHRAGVQGTFGGGTRRMPVRDPLRFRPETRVTIKDMLERYIMTGDLPAVEEM